MIRTSIATGKKLPQNELLRIGLVNSEVKFDFGKNFKGRGCYICPTFEELDKAILNQGIVRVLKINRSLTEAEVDNLRKDLKDFIEKIKGFPSSS